MKIQIVLTKFETVIIEVESLTYLDVFDAVYDQLQSHKLAGMAWTKVKNGEYTVVE